MTAPKRSSATGAMRGATTWWKLGFNYRLTEIEAALALVQLDASRGEQPTPARRVGRGVPRVATGASSRGMGLPFDGFEYRFPRPERGASAYHLLAVRAAGGRGARAGGRGPRSPPAMQTSVHYRSGARRSPSPALVARRGLHSPTEARGDRARGC